eukprot:1105446-Amphidinium_carterae.1
MAKCLNDERPPNLNPKRCERHGGNEPNSKECSPAEQRRVWFAGGQSPHGHGTVLELNDETCNQCVKRIQSMPHNKVFVE